MFHQWMSGDEDTCSCLRCSLTVSGYYLFREDLEHRVVIGISVILPDCQTNDGKSHYIDSEGQCLWCSQYVDEMTTVVCDRPE